MNLRGKISAIETLCQSHNIQRSEVLALGDYDTDMEIIRWAGVGALMMDAPQSLKLQAPGIAPSNDDHGIAHMIRAFVVYDGAN